MRGKHINVSVCVGVTYHGGSQMICTDMILIQIICDVWQPNNNIVNLTFRSTSMIQSLRR